MEFQQKTLKSGLRAGHPIPNVRPELRQKYMNTGFKGSLEETRDGNRKEGKTATKKRGITRTARKREETEVKSRKVGASLESLV